jgi:hypothetical protein
MTTFFGIESSDITQTSRTTLVRVLRGADSGLFGGWGVRI